MAESKSASLATCRRPNSRMWLAQPGGRSKRRSGVGALRLFGGLGYAVHAFVGLDLREVGVEDLLFHHRARALVQGVGDVLEGSVLAALARHGDEETGVAADDLEVANHKAVVEHD